MSIYKINFDKKSSVLNIGFGKPASNNDIVKEIEEKMKEISPEIVGTKCLKITGPCSLPGAMVIAHSVAHIVGAVAVFDPKINSYIIVVSHDKNYEIGDILINNL